jgi:hypothetical protein
MDYNVSLSTDVIEPIVVKKRRNKEDDEYKISKHRKKSKRNKPKIEDEFAKGNHIILQNNPLSFALILTIHSLAHALTFALTLFHFQLC